MAEYSFNLQFGFLPQYAGRSDGRCRFYDADDALVASTTDSITSIALNGSVIYNAQVSGIADTFVPGYAVFDFSDDATIEAETVSSEALALLIRTQGRSSGSYLVLTYDYDAFYAGRADGRFRLYEQDGVTLVTGYSASVSEVATESYSRYIVTVTGIPADYVPGMGVFDFSGDSSIDSTTTNSVALASLLSDASGYASVYGVILPTGEDDSLPPVRLSWRRTGSDPTTVQDVFLADAYGSERITPDSAGVWEKELACAYSGTAYEITVDTGRTARTRTLTLVAGSATEFAA